MKIRNGLIAASAALALASLATSASASGAANATATSSVTVLSPVTLAVTTNMLFGQVIKPSNANNNVVTLNASDVTSISGLGDGSVVAGGAQSAKFLITAPVGTTYTTVQTLTFAQPGLTLIAASTPTATTGTLGTVPAGGTQELRYGGNFTMNSSTTAQAYTGTLAVTLNYN